MKLKKGKYKIKIYKEGYVAKNGVVDLNKNHNLTITLNKIKKEVINNTKFKENYLPPLSNTFVDNKLTWQDDKNSKTVKVTEYSAKLLPKIKTK